MAISVDLPEQLVHDAEQSAQGAKRTVASQIELWVHLGKAVESLLRAEDGQDAAPLSECLETVNSEAGRERLRSHLQSLPFPHYEAAPHAPGMLIRIDEDGTRTLGRFVNRQLQPSDAWTSPPSTSGQ
ncbi:MAG: hypothetical protein HYR84_11040 [Planctomycetes bacterium]|nr:hypothetical protein [Planctomycetota bacterium]